MKIALLMLLGLALGALVWVEVFKTSNVEGYSGMLVFFTFMPLGSAVGALVGGLAFGWMAIRDAEIAIEEPARRQDG